MNATPLALLVESLRPLVALVASLDLHDAGAAQGVLEERAPLHGELLGTLRAQAQSGVDEGWLLQKESAGIRFGRVAKDILGFSVDAVLSAGAGGRHRHPEGEVDLLFAIRGAPRFDGHAEGWAVYPPGSEHVPGVVDGTMLILYFLPHGRIEWL